MMATSSPAWREIGRLLRLHRRPMAAALALVAVSRVAAMGLPASSKYVVDEVIGRQRADRMDLIAVLACTAVAIEAAAGFGAALIAGVAGQRAMAELRQDLQARVLGLPMRHFDAWPGGILAARVMADSEQVRYLVGNGLVQLIASALTATFALGLLFAIDSTLTLAVLALVALVAFAVGRTFGRISRGFESVIRRQAALTGWLGQVLGGIQVVKAYAAERHEAGRFAEQSQQLVRESVVVIRRISLLSGGNTLAAGSVGLLLLVLGGRTVVAGDMSLGSYVMFVWLSGFLLAPMLHIAGSSGELAKAVAAASKIAELKNFTTESEEDRSGGRLTPMIGAVEVDNVSYGYSPGRLALNSVNLRAPAGSMTALVGPNGSGKSTLCRLLLAYDRPTSGRIVIDGRDLASLNRRTYRSRIGTVLQDDLLFEGTIAENIRYGRPCASLDEVQAAARLAHCDEFVAHFPDGYSTLVGERGRRLSAGQRQRVAIARALLVNPRILILDEATSNVDLASESVLLDALRLLCRGRTTFIIAHRLSTMLEADQILVLDRGCVVARGTQVELLARYAPCAGVDRVAALVGGDGRGR